MKRLLTALLVAGLVGGLAHGKDLPQGTIEIEGLTSGSFMSMNVQVEDEDLLDISLWQIVAAGDVYVFDNIGVGGMISYVAASPEVEGSDMTVSSLMIGPEVKFNLSLAEQASLFAFGTIGYAMQSIEVDSESQDISGFFWRAGGGVKFFVSPSASLNLSLSYQMLSETEDESDAEMDLSGFALNAGLAVYL